MIASTSASDVADKQHALKNQETVTGPQCDFRSALLQYPFLFALFAEWLVEKEETSLGPWAMRTPKRLKEFL